MQVIGKTGRVINLPDQLATRLLKSNRVKEYEAKTEAKRGRKKLNKNEEDI